MTDYGRSIITALILRSKLHRLCEAEGFTLEVRDGDVALVDGESGEIAVFWDYTRRTEKEAELRA